MKIINAICFDEQLTISLRLDNKINRQLTCSVTPDDDAEVLTDELVQHEFIAKLDHSLVCNNIEKELALARHNQNNPESTDSSNNNSTSNGPSHPQDIPSESASNNVNINNRYNNQAPSTNGTLNKINNAPNVSSNNSNHHGVMNGTASPHHQRSSNTNSSATTNNNSHTPLVNGRMHAADSQVHQTHNSAIPR